MTGRFQCPPDHRHAEVATCYTMHKCRCLRCRLRNNARSATDRRLRAYGTWAPGRIDPAPVAEHVRFLMAFGYSYDQIATAAGVNEGTPYRVVHGRLKYVHGRVGRAILAVKPTLDDLAPHTLIPTRGARRRLQALAYNGWTMQALADQLGRSRGWLSHINGEQSLQLRNHQLIANLYERLWDVEPTPAADEWGQRSIDVTRARARRLGWLPPLAWDDIDTDVEPPAVERDVTFVDTVAVGIAVDGYRIELTTAERRLATEQLTKRGYSSSEIADLLSVSARTITRDRGHDIEPDDEQEAEAA